MTDVDTYKKILKECVAYRLGIISIDDMLAIISTSVRLLSEDDANRSYKSMLHNAENDIELILYTIDQEKIKSKAMKVVQNIENQLKKNLNIHY